MTQMLIYLINNMIMLILMIINILISVAFLTLFERKVMSYFHYRKGPNKISLAGILQPFSDAMKLLTKEYMYPLKANFYYYSMAPMLMFIIIMGLWLIYPFLTNISSSSLNFMYLLCLLSLGGYGLMISGWSSNTSFAMLGSMRSIAQSISYEVTLSISMLIILMSINYINLNYMYIYQKNLWLMFLFFMPAMILFLSMLAEINRTPFDLSEGESELVSGFNIEYSSGNFVLIFLSEYASIIFMMFIFSLMFACKNLMSIIFYLTLISLLFLIIWIRVTLPRIRYDYLMYFCWFFMLPMSLILFMYYMIFLKFNLEILFLFN